MSTVLKHQISGTVSMFTLGLESSDFQVTLLDQKQQHVLEGDTQPFHI